jgi:hypothetical protein
LNGDLKDAETLEHFENEALRQSYLGRRSSKSSQHVVSASAAEVKQACVVQEQPTRTSASRRRIKRLQKLVGQGVAPVSSYLWQGNARHIAVSSMRDGRVSQRAAVKIVSRRPGSQRDDGLNRGFQIWIVGCYYERQAVSCDGTLSEETFLETKVEGETAIRCGDKKQLRREGTTEQDLQGDCLI